MPSPRLGSGRGTGRPESPCHDARVDSAAFGFLLSPDGRELLRSAEAIYDGSNALAVASSLRKNFESSHVAAAITLTGLRRRGRAKFGEDAATMYFTPDGLEQATHPIVAAHRAVRLRHALHDVQGSVVDLGCGIGSDLLAFAGQDLRATGVEMDQLTAAVARANLGVRGCPGEVVVADARSTVRSSYDVTFVDPARRGAAGRTFDPAAYEPPWSFVEDVLTGPAVVKVAPGIPHELVPAGVEAEWVSLGGRLKEAALWSVGPDRVRRRATVLRDGAPEATISDQDAATEPTAAPPGRFVYEPDDAVVRAHLVTAVCAIVSGWLLDEHLAYVASDRLVPTPLARAYEVVDVLPFKEKQLRAALRARDIGALTIKKRGITVTPEGLRSRLALTGSTPGTLILSRTPRSSVALLVEPRG